MHINTKFNISLYNIYFILYKSLPHTICCVYFIMSVQYSIYCNDFI